jgi:hypothetical protein
MLQWLRAKGCPWDSDVCIYAAACGHEAVVHWALACGGPEALIDADEPDNDGSEEDF